MILRPEAHARVWHYYVGLTYMSCRHILLHMGIRLLTLKMLRSYQVQFPEAADELAAWHKVIRTTSFANFAEVKAGFPDASWVAPDYLIFNILHNRFRLITTISFPTGQMFLKEFLTHQAYDDWTPDRARIEAIKLKKAKDKKAAKRQGQ